MEKSRAALVNKMSLYYYETSQSVWDTWTDSDLHNWLIENDIITPNIKISRDKAIAMVSYVYSHFLLQLELKILQAIV